MAQLRPLEHRIHSYAVDPNSASAFHSIPIKLSQRNAYSYTENMDLAVVLFYYETSSDPLLVSITVLLAISPSYRCRFDLSLDMDLVTTSIAATNYKSSASGGGAAPPDALKLQAPRRRRSGRPPRAPAPHLHGRARTEF
ncbi:hypothetical protein EVAR_36888_1 [Eumeta japonica]|uniref:Uncharacterized protein n=1 Tax=Eumeta variegata TaxID=151549 RepID=A0A4C1WV77_EUMVA|nr:hypothetical protein EVAR_36888_1 [Eumeta japonica]